MERPRLIESNARMYISNTLRVCCDSRKKFYLTILNVIICLFFTILFMSGLYYCRQKRLTPYEKYRKQLKDQEYVLEKIRQFQIDDAKKHISLTNLPLLVPV